MRFAYDFLMSHRLLSGYSGVAQEGSMRMSRVVLATICSVLAVAGTSAQSIFGGIVGTVKDPVQSAVVAAQVILTDSDDGQKHQATTDGNGAFEFVNLKPGHYDIVVTVPGF